MCHRMYHSQVIICRRHHLKSFDCEDYMNKLTRPVWVDINLDHLAHNMREVRRVTASESLVSAVIKADGYGHGALYIAQTLLDNEIGRAHV